MNKVVFFFFLFASILFGANECIVCHKGIADIRDKNSDMMKAILDVAKEAGHEGNDCIVCHGGNPYNKSVEYAHKGTVKYFKNHKGPKSYYPTPASASVNRNSCGPCHTNQVNAQTNSLMFTEQGKMQRAMWNFGAKESYSHREETYYTNNSDNPDKRFGTDTYKKYMQNLTTIEPQIFLKEIRQLSAKPTLEEIHKNPSLAIYTYLDEKKSNSFNKKGCESCHIPYSNDGKVLTHQIQSSRKVKVSVDDINYTGVPVASCSACHKDEKSIALSYQGLMQTGDNNSKQYLHMKDDIHFKKGMLCQDCHTSNDLHGDGFLSATNSASVEVECQDCHGTTKKYPWELPIGYSDEFNTTVASGSPRGVSKSIAEYLKQGYVAQEQDGYILTARGNPLPKAVKKGNVIIMHLASGKDIELKPLKLLKKNKELSKNALVAMDVIDSHTKNMECYTCHATWAPQFYGGNIKVDYSAKSKVTQSKSFIRWEEPSLAQNGEGRLSPVVPQNQTSITVIAKDGKDLLRNHKFKKESIIDMVPIQPHTIQKESRTCESCHVSDKALGLGIGEVINDYSKFVDDNTTDFMTLSNYGRLSGILTKDQREKLDRRGLCLSCHEDIPSGNLAVSAMIHVGKMAEIKIDKQMHFNILNKLLSIAAWAQILGGLFISLLIMFVIYIMFLKKEPVNPRNEGWK
jgi:hypothetical protein